MTHCSSLRSPRRPLQRWIVACLLWSLVAAAPSRAEDVPPGVSWEILSMRGRAFAPLLGDPREAQFRFGFLVDQDARILEDLVWGGDLGLLRVEAPGVGVFTITGRGLMTARFDVFSDSFDLQNTDFIGGVAAGYGGGPWAAELFFFHQSSHLGDEILERGDRQRSDVSFERIRALLSYQLAWFRLYGGVHVVVHAWPDSLLGRTAIQLGAETALDLGPVPFFAAADVQTRVDAIDLLGLTVTAGVGVGEAGPAGRRQRIFLSYYEGLSLMGQFFAEHERHAMLGVAYVFQ